MDEPTTTASKRHRPSIDDVAEMASVSIKTVSRVINGSSNVRASTEKRVRQAIEQLGYSPSSSARQLARSRGQRTVSVGIVVPMEPEKVMFHRYFFEALQGFGDVLQGDGHQLILHVQARNESFVDIWRNGGTDGLIVMSVPARDRRVTELLKESTPFVLTCRPDEPGSPLDEAVSWVDADHTSGGRVAMNHLLSLGHRRIAVINGPDELMVSRLRAAGIHEALSNHDVRANDITFVSAEFSVEEGRAIGTMLLGEPQPPTAIFCGDDTLALGVMNAAELAGLRVPEDLSVVGYDDIEVSKFLKPPLTTVRQGARLKGRLAAAALLRRIDSASPREGGEHHLLTTELVVRDSTAVAPM